MASKKWKSYAMPNETKTPREDLVGYTLIQEVKENDSLVSEKVVGIIIDATDNHVVFYLDPEMPFEGIQEVVVESVKSRKVEENE